MSGHLLVIARNAHEGMTATKSESQIVIAFAAMALEAFLNEVEDLAAQGHLAGNDRIIALGHTLSVGETSRASAMLKIEPLR